MYMTKRETIIRRFRVNKVGISTRTIAIPIGWFRAHDLDPDKVKELLVVANEDIRIVNPRNEDDVHKGGHKIADKAPKLRR